MLAEFGADFDDVVKLNRWYAGDVGVASFEPAALACAAHFPRAGARRHRYPRPTARERRGQDQDRGGGDAGRGRPAPAPPARVAGFALGLARAPALQARSAMRGDDLHRRAGVARQAGPGGASERSLRADPPGDGPHRPPSCKRSGRTTPTCARSLRSTRATAGAEALHANLPIRSSYFADPGPATTGIPMPVLAYDAMMVEIDAFAMKRGSSE